MIFENVVKIGDYIYQSQLYANYFAIDFIQSVDGVLYRVRCPYKTKDSANVALSQLKKGLPILNPDYRPELIKDGILLCTR